MPVIPWKMAERPVAGIRYLALVSYLPLKHFRALPKFFRFTFEIQRQLQSTPGLIGYSLDARPFARKFWTLSLWRDQQSHELRRRIAAHSGDAGPCPAHG